jgi:hypothetical protein
MVQCVLWITLLTRIKYFVRSHLTLYLLTKVISIYDVNAAF